MADKTLIVNGQPFTINRDRKAEVSQLTVNGQPFTINRTAPVIESDRKGESRPLLSKVVGGASAAYSLRDLNSKQGDTNVANVRRSTDNTEKIFQAKDVHTIDEWVNGKQETTLPCDVATAAAAYSLRKVKSDYTGNAVRIRRSTDLIEVNVAFDSEGKVSVNSPVTNVVEPMGIERGSTSATTLGGFLTEGGTNYDAFVVYWYDQVGSNHAHNITHSSQPKIASSGALLDGILFDNGSSGAGGIHLQANSMTTGSATDNFVSAVIDRNSLSSSNMGAIISTRSGNSDGFTYGIHSNGYPQIFYTGNGNYSVSTEILPTTGKILLSFDKDSTVGTIHKNATTPTPSSNTLSGYGNSSNVFNIGSIKRPSQSPSNGFMGLMSEVIVYNSDQADNRFKIESNINNYYGLYNDANELTGNFTVDSSGTGTNASISNESKNGFTATVVDKAGFFGVDLNQAVPNGSNLYISFNANLSPSGGTAATPNFSLADSSAKTGNSTGSPLDTAVVEGFNSITVAGTASTCNRIRFTEGNDNVSFIISNLKVSRIARNGFVETWHDQSGNGRNMVQDNAGYQPRIVKNGGQVKDPSGHNPSINFGLKGTGQGGLHFKLLSNIPQASSNTLTALFVASLDTDTITAPRLAAGAVDFNLSSSEVLQSRFGNNRTSTPNLTVSTDDNSFIGFTVNSSLVPKYYLNNSAASTSSAHSGTGTPTVFQLLGENALGGDTQDRYHWSGTISEAILYLSDQTNNLPAIKANINNQYQIY